MVRAQRRFEILAAPDRAGRFPGVGNVRQLMRDHWLSSRTFSSCDVSSYDDIVDRSCRASNSLIDQPWRIMSIGLRQWAHEY
ncbi:hypothetical protein [Sphingomonas oligophenolica]|uniref:hypothetical protein n=1 Tax=Sphingomonas oligophenolica TaxID=301154 RepID=UPI003D0663FE